MTCALQLGKVLGRVRADAIPRRHTVSVLSSPSSSSGGCATGKRRSGRSSPLSVGSSVVAAAANGRVEAENEPPLGAEDRAAAAAARRAEPPSSMLIRCEPSEPLAGRLSLRCREAFALLRGALGADGAAGSAADDDGRRRARVWRSVVTPRLKELRFLEHV